MFAFQKQLEVKARQMFVEVINGEDYAREFPGLTNRERQARVASLMNGLTLGDVVELGLLDEN